MRGCDGRDSATLQFLLQLSHHGRSQVECVAYLRRNGFPLERFVERNRERAGTAAGIKHTKIGSKQLRFPKERSQRSWVPDPVDEPIVDGVVRGEEPDDLARVHHSSRGRVYRTRLASPSYMKVIGLGPFI